MFYMGEKGRPGVKPKSTYMERIFVLAETSTQVHNTEGFALYAAWEVVDNRRKPVMVNLRLSGEMPAVVKGTTLVVVGKTEDDRIVNVGLKDISIYSADADVFNPPYPFTFMGEWVASTSED